MQITNTAAVSEALCRLIYRAECVEQAGRFALFHYTTPGHFAPDAVICLDDSDEAEAFNAAVRRVQYARHGIVDNQRRQRIAAAVRALLLPLMQCDPMQAEAWLVLKWAKGIA